MDFWLIWLAAAVALAAVELFTTTAVFGIFAVAALVPTGLDLFGVPLVVQVISFAIAAGVGMIGIRPIALRHLHGPALARFGIDALVGKTAFVVREVNDRDGLVRIEGEEWTARSFDGVTVIPVGAAVDVLRISGTTAFVYPKE